MVGRTPPLLALLMLLATLELAGGVDVDATVDGNSNNAYNNSNNLIQNNRPPEQPTTSKTASESTGTVSTTKRVGKVNIQTRLFSDFEG